MTANRSPLFPPDEEEEGGSSDSPSLLLERLYPKFKPTPFDVTPLRDHETRIVMEAMKLEPGRTMMTYHAAKQILDMQKDRERRAEAAAKARARYRAKAASRKA